MSNDMVFLNEFDTKKFLKINKITCDLLEYGEEEFLQLDFASIVVDFDEKNWDEVTKNNCSFEKIVKSKSGKCIQVELNIKTIEFENQKFILSIVRDISEKVRMNEEKKKLFLELIHSQKMEALGRLAHGISHDFSNLLSIIIGFSELLIDKNNNNDNERELKIIIKSAYKASNLANRILQISTNKSDKNELISLNRAIDNMKNLLNRIVGENISIIFDLMNDNSYICSNKSQIEQIILNLIVNARDAMINGGTITISTKICGKNDIPQYKRFIEIKQNENELLEDMSTKNEEFICLKVRDTGIGIKDDTKYKIFEPYFTTKQNSSGLGLPTVYAVIKDAKGFIDVESQVGKGSSFKIYFPLKIKKNLAEKRKKFIKLSKSYKILIIEDDPLVTKVLKHMCMKQNFQVDTVSSGEEALEYDKLDDIDLILCDLMLTGISGLETLDLILPKYPNIQPLLMTGYPEEHFDFGNRTWPLLKKPIGHSSLFSMISEILTKNENKIT